MVVLARDVCVSAMILSSCGQALLFTKLMGPTVLSASIVQTPAPEPASPVRVYAHCARDRGVTVMLINLRSATTPSSSLVASLETI